MAMSSGEWTKVALKLTPGASTSALNNTATTNSNDEKQQQDEPYKNNNHRRVSLSHVEAPAALSQPLEDDDFFIPRFRSLAPNDSAWILNRATEDVWNVYEQGKVLGVPGAYGCAYAATNRETGRPFVVKMIDKRRRGRIQLNMFRREIQVMRSANHKNVIKYHDVFESETHLFIVMEMCTGGDMFDEIDTLKRYSERHAQFYVRQILKGLQHLHEQNICHCDLKPDNFVFTTPKRQTLKIIDFGMAKFWQAEEKQLFDETCGTPYYAAPEVIERKYNLACDMWSMGVIIFIMLIGYPPFYVSEMHYKELFGSSEGQRKANVAIRKKVTQGFQGIVKKGVGSWFPEERPISKDARDLITLLLQKDVAKRPTVQEALQHPWMANEASDEPLAQIVLQSLREFTVKESFQHLVLQMMVDLLPDSEVEALTRTFEAMDTNGDSMITIDEFKGALRDRGSFDEKLTAAEIERIFSSTDVDKDGAICYKEMLYACVHFKLVAKEERMRRAFEQLDKDGDGRITASELQEFVRGRGSWRSGMYNAEALIHSADLDKNGWVDYEEFLKMWRLKF